MRLRCPQVSGRNSPDPQWRKSGSQIPKGTMLMKMRYAFKIWTKRSESQGILSLPQYRWKAAAGKFLRRLPKGYDYYDRKGLSRFEYLSNFQRSESQGILTSPHNCWKAAAGTNFMAFAERVDSDDEEGLPHSGDLRNFHKEWVPQVI